ncbi:MAG: arginine N-succinyltransferase [Planctomycetota bacterium]
MFIIRRAKVDDADTLLKLSRMVHFINLPPDREIIVQKIIHSRNSFLSACGSNQPLEPEPEPTLVADSGTGELKLVGLGQGTAESDLFMFVLEELETSQPVGTSQVLARMGGVENPNVRYKLEKREFFSESLQTGTTHMVARFDLDRSGPSEIGGLIIQPSFRGHPKKLGRSLALIRFHFIGLHRALFSDRILAEMMAPITAEGDNLLWDYLGRRFVPLSYDEADRFCQYSREFIHALLPKDDIYLSLLPPAARALVGQVGPETIPARKMLERLGFEYHGYVDPFDGGPHLEARTDELSVVRDTKWKRMGEPAARSACSGRALVSLSQNDGDFFACEESYCLDARGRVCLPRQSMEAIYAEPGDRIGFTPLVPAGQRTAGTSARGGKASGSNKTGRKTATKPAARKKRAAATTSAARKTKKKPARRA